MSRIIIKAFGQGERPLWPSELSRCPHPEPVTVEWILSNCYCGKKKKKKKKQCFLGVWFSLFAFPTLSEPLLGVQSCLNLPVCVSGGGAGPCLGGAGGGRARPRDGQGPQGMPRPPLALLSCCVSSLSCQLNTLPDLSLPPCVDLLLCLYLLCFHFRVLLPPVTPFLLHWGLSAQLPQEKECAD